MSEKDLDARLLSSMKAASKSEAPAPSPDSPLASVALVLADADPRLLFIKRALHPEDPWSGHVALPGGRAEADDPHIEATARRETLEEVGLSLKEDQLWGSLPPVQARARGGRSNLWVMPHVYRISGPCPRLSLAREEVQAARWIPVSRLLEPDVQDHVKIEVPTGRMKLPAWVVDDFTIWGLTYFMVRRLLDPLISGK